MKRCLVLIGLVIAISVRAQDQSAARVLTFEEAVKIAIQNNVLLNQQRNNLELSQMQKISAIAQAAPAINANAGVSRSNGNNFNQNLGEVVNGTFDAFNVGIRADLNVFSGFSRINQIRQFSKALDAQSYFVQRTVQDAINQVATQYLLVMRDAELLRIGRQNFEALSKQLEQINEMVSLGSRSQVDAYNQEALTRAAELTMVQAEITLNNDKATLAQTLLMDPFEDFTTEAPNWDANAIGNEPLNIQELADRAKQYRADYLRAEKSMEAQRFALAAARGQYLPSLAAFAQLGSRYNFDHTQSRYVMDSLGNETSTLNRFYPRPFGDQLRTDNIQKAIGLTLQIPLFNGFQQRTTVVQQKVLYENARINKTNLDFQIKNDVLRTVRNFEGAKKAFSVSSYQLTAAEMAFQFESERYNLGVTNFVDYTNANRALVLAQTSKAQAEYTLVFQKVLLEYAVGTLKPEDVTTGLK